MINRLLNVGLRFRSRFRLVTGQEFFGQLLSIPDTSRVSNFLTPRRYLRTQPDTFLTPGMVMIDKMSDRFILGEHGTGYFIDPIYKHFKMFEVDLQATWYQLVEKTNLVTNLKTKAPTKDMGTVYLSVQPHPSIEDVIHVQNPTKIAICNKPIGVDDKVGDFVVTKSDAVLGVYLLELKEI